LKYSDFIRYAESMRTTGLIQDTGLMIHIPSGYDHRTIYKTPRGDLVASLNQPHRLLMDLSQRTIKTPHGDLNMLTMGQHELKALRQQQAQRWFNSDMQRAAAGHLEYRPSSPSIAGSALLSGGLGFLGGLFDK